MMTRPQVGKQVTVVVRNFVHKPVFVPQWNDCTALSPETNTYTGTVVKSYYWMKVDEFNLTTDQRAFPIRTISLKNVISIDGAKVDGQSANQIVSKIIKGSKGNEYVVMLNNGVAETCTCPAFLYRGGRCKHLAIASGEEQAVPVVVAPKTTQTHVNKIAKPKATKLQRAREMYRTSKGDRKSTINLFMAELDMTPAGAQSYYYICKKG